jgi:hypothetical protein
VRAGLAKEEYATTWQEENEKRGAEDEAHGTFACRCLTEDQRAQDGRLSEASRKTIGEADRQANCKASRQANCKASRQANCEASRQANRQQPQAANGRAADTGANRSDRAGVWWRHGWRRTG